MTLKLVHICLCLRRFWTSSRLVKRGKMSFFMDTVLHPVYLKHGHLSPSVKVDRWLLYYQSIAVTSSGCDKGIC